MFFFLSKILDQVVDPIAWVLVLIVVGAFVKRPRVRYGALAMACVVLVLAACAPVANRLTRPMEVPADRTFREDVTYDAVIVLGGLVEGAPTESAGTPQYNGDVERLLAAYDLLRTGKARAAILSGGTVDAHIVEADVMKTQLVDWGIAPERLFVEGESRNTRENAVNSARIVHAQGFQSIVLVTSAIHMPRAHGCFRAKDVAIPVDTLPVDFRSYDPAIGSAPWLPRAHALEDTSRALREGFGRWVYRLRGYSS